jgi:signal transduction histidine kinase
LSEIEDIIRQIPLFAGLGAGQLAQLCTASQQVAVKAGDIVIEEGAPGEALFIILSGELEITKRADGHDIVLASRKAGEFLGEMSLLERSPRTASARATRDTELLEIDAAAFQHLIESHPSIATTILRTVAARLRSTESSLMQREKLASLGTLAAGLAHELNNPAAAIQRSSSYLEEMLNTSSRQTSALRALAFSPAEARQLSTLEVGLTAAPQSSPSSATEGLLMAQLEKFGIENPWDIAPALAAAGWTVARLDVELSAFEPPHRNAILSWLGAELSARQLAGEIQRSGQAIADIVHAVKSYAYLDQAAVQHVDIVQSLEDTLMILKHKLKAGVRISRDFEPDLPRVEAYAGALNQVWTNLIDNAIDAMAGAGDLDLRARRLLDGVEVVITDSGPGIPPEVSAKIFDPFFTTKPQGIGTGLGLHIAHNIIVTQHHGRIAFDTRPGQTEFSVFLPTKLAREAGR